MVVTSKTHQAMKMVDQGMAPYRAAREVGISPNTLYVALKRRRESLVPKVECPCCGSLAAEEMIKRG